MKAIAPGTIVFHQYRGYGVLTAVNLLTGWVSVRFGSEKQVLDLNLSCDDLQHANGEPIRFRLAPPDRTPHARLMAMMRELHKAGYERLYLHSSPRPSGMHWRWHIFTGNRNWMHPPWREGWYGSGYEYIFNPVMGWGDPPEAGAMELIRALAKFDPEGLAQALGRDEDHTQWFKYVCEKLLPDYMYSMDVPKDPAKEQYLNILPVRNGVAPYKGEPIPLPPGWKSIWRAYATPQKSLVL